MLPSHAHSGHRTVGSVLRLPVVFMLASILVGFSSAIRADTPDYRFEATGGGSALANTIVTCMLQDRRGYLWIGTYQNGLFRFDGYSFRRFAHDPRDPSSLGSNRLWALAEDRDGSIWVGTWGHGLARFDPATQRFERFRHSEDDPESIGDDTITALLVDSAGTLWVGTAHGLNRRTTRPGEPPRFARYPHDPQDPRSLGADMVWGLVESRGTLVVGLRYGGLDCVDLAGVREHEPLPFGRRFRSDPNDPNALSSNNVWSMASSADGRVWIGMIDGGLNRVDPATGVCERLSSERLGLKSLEVRNLFEDSRGYLWISVRYHGIQRYDPRTGEVAHYGSSDDDPTSLTDDQIVSMLETREGLLWFGTWGGGLNKLDPWSERFGLHRHRTEDPRTIGSNRVSAILVDSDGALWVGTEDGLNRRRAGSDHFDKFVADKKTPGALRNEWIGHLYEDPDGTLWVGTKYGPLQSLSPSERRRESVAAIRFTTYADIPGHPLGQITDMMSVEVDREGRYWFGTKGGSLFRWDGASLERFQYDKDDPTSLGQGAVYSIHEDSDGAIWVTTRETGLCRFDPARRAFKRYQHADGDPDTISGTSTTRIAEDSRGDLWIGTLDTGLNRLDRRTGKFTQYREADGLASDSVFGVLVDGGDRVWVATSRGLDRLDPVTGSVTHFDERDGLQSGNFTSMDCAGFLGTDGRIYVGGFKGFNVFHPDRIEGPREPPPVTLTDFLLLNKSAPVSESGPITREIGLLDRVSLGHSDYLFGFEFSALSFRKPEKNRYQYRLEGYDADWIESDAKDRKAVYTGIPPGTYTFRVRAANADGVWNEQGVAIVVRVTPPWWRTWWAYLFYIVTGVGLALTVVQLRLRSLERRSAELEALVEQRTVELATSERFAREAHQEADAERAKAVEAREEALGASRAKSIFLANMSHELRTPLNAVIGFAQLLERSGDFSRDDRESLQIIQRSGEHLLGLINDVLSITKIEAGKLTLVTKPFDPVVLLKAIQGIIRVRAEDKALEVVFEVDPEMPRSVVGDEGRLRQVLINLLGNAVKFTERGRVTLRARWSGSAGERAFFEVEDTGYGISEEELKKLFEAFQQTESGRTSTEGTGLGLVISRQIVRLMGGDIRVKSQFGRGTVFDFDVALPASDEAVMRGERRQIVGLAAGQVPPRILIVDDTAENRLLLARLLATVGFEVREAANGKEAVEEWAAWHPHLIFMDMRMPVMDGLEAMRRIRAAEVARGQDPGSGIHSKIIALTASAFEHERENILSTGADDFVTKPYRVEMIFGKLAEYLGVTYRYEEYEEGDAKTQGAEEHGVLSPERVATLPWDALDRLYEALSAGDFERAASVAEGLEQVDGPLGRALLARIRRFELDELLSLFEAVDRNQDRARS